MAGQTRVVVLGAGFAGLAVARALRREKQIQITIVDRTNHHLFQPLLYQVAVAGLNPAEIASPVRSVLRQKNLVSLMGTVTSIDPEAKKVVLNNGLTVLEYDFLVLAMGGKTSYFGHDRWEAVAPGLKTLADALDIRQRVLYAFERAERSQDPEERNRLMTLVVVGGGPTGVEMAGALAELTRLVIRWDFKRIQPQNARVILLEGGGRLLAGFPDKLSDYTQKRLGTMGVEVLLNEKVLDIAPGLVKTDKQEIAAENVVWAAGVGGHPLTAALGVPCDRGGRAMVEPDLRLPGHDSIYCLGDMAHYEHPHTFGGKALPGVAPAAMQQGAWAARNIQRQLKSQPTEAFRYLDKGSMATIGRSAAVARSGPLNMTGFPAWMAWLTIHLMYLVSFQNQILVLMRWTWSYFTWKWGARLITRIPEYPPTEPGNPSAQEST